MLECGCIHNISFFFFYQGHHQRLELVCLSLWQSPIDSNRSLYFCLQFCFWEIGPFVNILYHRSRRAFPAIWVELQEESFTYKTRFKIISWWRWYGWTLARIIPIICIYRNNSFFSPLKRNMFIWKGYFYPKNWQRVSYESLKWGDIPIQTLKVLCNSFLIGPSEVRVLTLGVAAERSVHYFWDSVLLIASWIFRAHILFSQKGFS